MMKKALALILIFVSFDSVALEMDSKLIGRVLGISDSKRTLLLNKGRENGLAEGNHAKISLPSGVIARAVVSRVSPSRSVWSVYRFYAKDKLQKNIAVTAKITSAITLTKDESKALGILATKYGKKKEEIIPKETVKEKAKQKKMERGFIRKDRVVSQFDRTDYSKLEDTMDKRSLDPSLDWSGLDGKKDQRNIDPNADFSELR